MATPAQLHGQAGGPGPACPGSAIETGADGPTTVAELEEAVSRADDKERLIGLLAAPIAAMIGLLVTGSRLASDPKAAGQRPTQPAARSSSTLVEFGAIAVVLGLVMLASAWFRKRLYLGIDHGPLRALSVQSPLLGIRGPVHLVRLLVSGPCLPAAIRN